MHRPLVLPGGRIRLGIEQYGVASEIVDDDGSLERLLELMDGSRTVDDIWAQLYERHPDWTLDDVRNTIDALVEAGHVEDLGAPVPSCLTDAEVERYQSAREYLAWIDTAPRTSPYDVLAKVRQARVVLLGLGGTGSAVATSLVASGIGALHCVDFDRVERSNLTRQLIFTEADVARPKTEVARERLTALNSTVAVTTQDLVVGSTKDVERLMDGYDVLVLCADEPADVIQTWVNEAALRTSTPWFIAAYTGAMTGVGGFVPGETGCWECIRRVERASDGRRGGRWIFDHKPHAVLAATAAVSGHLCALEVLHHVGGLPSQARGRIFQLNLACWEHQYFVDAVRDPDCAACGAAHR